MNKHPINTDIKNSCNVLVKDITGKDIKEAIPQPQNRLHIYQIYQKMWSKKGSWKVAEKKVREWIRNWEIAKASVSIAIKAITGTDIKTKIPKASNRSGFYWMYMKKGEDYVIIKIKKIA